MIFAGTLPAFVGCVGSSIKPENTVVGTAGSAEGQWRGKALLRNLQNGKSGTLSLDIVAHEPACMRMEVTGMMGIYVASFALKDSQVQYLIAQQKKFVIAPADMNALHELVPIRITPQELVRLLFDRTLSNKDWSCQNDALGLPSVCQHIGDGIRVTWLERNGGHRKFKIESKNADATLVLDESRSNVESADTGQSKLAKLSPDIYTLQAPPGYRQETHVNEN